MICVELSGTILQYSDTVEGSLLTISCLEGYFLPGGDMMSVCTNGSWSPHPLNTMCLPAHLQFYISGMCNSSGSTGTGLTAAVIVGLVCSLMFLIVGVLYWG